MTTTDLWAAVDALTKPSRQRLHRSGTGEFHALAETERATDLLRALATDPNRTVCHVADYRRAVRRLGLQHAGHAVIPSLWDQAAASVVNAGEQIEGGGTSPLRERSPADLELMEALYKIRDAVYAELEKHGRVPRLSMCERIRQVASLVVADADEQRITWWARRVERWVSDLTAKLDAADAGPKPFRIRDTPCPRCGVRQIRVFEQGEWRLVPPIQIDFRDGQVRAAECGGCRATWFRGEQLNMLADTLGRSAVVAEPA